MADRLARMVKFRDDQLSRPRPNDMGLVAIPAITDPVERAKTARQALEGFIASNSVDHPEAKKSMQALRSYLEGKADMPQEWVLDESPLPSAEGLYVQRAAKERERLSRTPFASEMLAMNDYFVQPLGRYASGAVDTMLNTGIGIANWFGARIPKANVRAQSLAGIRAIVGDDPLASLLSLKGADIRQPGTERSYDRTRAERELAGMDKSASGLAQTVGDVADIAGMLRGFRQGGVAGATTTGTMKLGELVGKTVTAPVAKVVGKVAGKATGKFASELAGGAGAFGAYEIVNEAAKQGQRPTGQQTLEALEHGAVAGAAMSTAAGVARVSLRKLFSEAAGSTKVAGEDGKILDAMKDWAKKNNIVPVPHQSVAAYGSKVIDSWIASGMQGAPPMAARRFIGRALEAGVESAGLSAINVQFQHDFVDAIFRQDPEAFARMAKTYGTNFLGVAASKMRMQDIPGFQRQQPSPGKKAKPVTDQPVPQDPEAAKRQESADAEQKKLVEERGQAQQRDLAEAFWRSYEEGDPAAIAAMGDQAIGDLLRQGWKFRRPEVETPTGDVKLETPLPPVEQRGKPSERMELPGTPFSFEVREGTVTPSQNLRELLSLPESLPAADFARIINKAGIFTDLDATTLLPGTQISAAPPIYADGEVMRTIAIDGTVLESPLGPEPKWTEAKELPARGSDVIPRPQQEVVDLLTHVLNTRADLPQSDVALLSKIITKLNTVSWQNDPAVAETLQHTQDLLTGIGNGSPEHASKALQVMGEMLTTKSPEVAMDDMVAGQTPAPEATSAQEPRPGEQKTPSEGGKNPTDTLFDAAKDKRLNELYDRAMSGDEEAQRQYQREVGDRGGEAGFIDVGHMARVTDIAIRRVVRKIMRMPLRSLAGAVGLVVDNKASRGFSVAAQEQGREQLPKPVADQFLQAETNTREYIDELSPLMEAIPGGRIRELEKRRWMEPTSSGVQMGFEVGHMAKDTDLGRLLGFDPSTLGDRARAALESWNKLTREIRRIASGLRMHVQGLWTPEGELAEIAPEAKKDVLTRQLTPELMDALRRGPGNWLYEAFVEGQSALNNMSRDDVERILAEDGWTDARSLKRRDAIEHIRRFKYFADHIKVPGHGVTRLLETQPLKHAKRMMYGAAMRMGTVKELGPDDPLPADPKLLLEQKGMAMADGLPTPYLRIVESVPQNARETAATVLRSLMGMQTNVLRSDMEVGGAAHKFWRLLGGLNDTEAASKMTFGSVIQNTWEAWTTGSALLGINRVFDAAIEVFPRIAAGEWRDLLRERQEAGGFAIHKGEWLLGGEESKFDQSMRALHTAGEALTLPLRMVQTVTDILVHKALHRAVADWREGTHGYTDADALMTMFGFSRAHAEQVVNGEAPPQVYRQIEMNGLTRITRTGDLAVNKSDFARSRNGLAQAIKYTGYFQAQFAKLRKAVMNLREAETAGQQATAAANVGKLLGFNMAGFMAGSSLVKLASGGWDELMHFWGETIEDVQSPEGAGKLALAAFVGSMAGSVGSALAGGIHALFTGNDRSKAEVLDTLTGAVPLIQGGLETWDFLNAAGHTLAEKPLSEENQYSGKSPLQQLGYYLGNQMPLAKWVESGPFGMGITYLGTDPKLENALKANRRIDNKLGINPFFGSERKREEDKNEDDVNDRDLFVQSMRTAVNKLKASEGDVDTAEIAQAIRDAMPDVDDKSIAASFLARRVLSGQKWNDLSEEKQESKLRSLGEDRVELLRGYDAVLEQAASYFRPNPLLRRRLRRR
jgi:hypothetical protein